MMHIDTKKRSEGGPRAGGTSGGERRPYSPRTGGDRNRRTGDSANTPKTADYMQRAFVQKERFQKRAVLNCPFAKVLLTRKVDKVVSGGKNSTFEALVVIGDERTKMGLALARGKTIFEAVQHAKEKAAKTIISPGQFKYIKHKFCSTTVIITKNKLTSIRAGNTYLNIFKACGITGVSCKIIGSLNTINCAKAIFSAFSERIQYEAHKKLLDSEFRAEKQTETISKTTGE